MPDTAVVVMARYPSKGQTKTRLARAIGDETTLQLYRAFLADVAHQLAGPTLDLYWTYTPPDVDYDGFIAELAPTLARYTRSFPQEGADLGARLHHAFAWTSNIGYKKTIVVGSDSPHIRRGMITDAQNALDETDVALGPADDGGYYLIAMRQPHDVFSGIPMSTSVVTEMTIAAAQRLGLTVSLIESLFDIDELPDLLRLAQLLREDAARAPHTAAALANINLSVHGAR
ncbi:MAG: TIGR04282 family arsenosugar biosynthesis glycosyltransferase [Ktedonobacteraceae bacterium]